MSTTKFFKLKPLHEILAGGQKVIDEVMAPLRERKVRAQAESKLVELDERMITLEKQINEAVMSEQINFDKALDLMDDYKLAERRRDQLQAMVGELFPIKTSKPASK